VATGYQPNCDSARLAGVAPADKLVFSGYTTVGGGDAAFRSALATGPLAFAFYVQSDFK
jgi:hypothetical protein